MSLFSRSLHVIIEQYVLLSNLLSTVFATEFNLLLTFFALFCTSFYGFHTFCLGNFIYCEIMKPAFTSFAFFDTFLAGTSLAFVFL